MKKDLLALIEKQKKGEVKKLVNKRVKEFDKKRLILDEIEIFSELCFCILTANFNAKRSIMIQKKIGSGFLTWSEIKLAEKLKELGHRYPNARAKYIVLARRHIKKIINVLKTYKKDEEIREWLKKNIKGLGYKEASHFLRNIGYKNFAIIDFHILDLLEKYNILEKPKSINKKNYIRIENVLKVLSKKTDLNLQELDLYLWFLETGQILK